MTTEFAFPEGLLDAPIEERFNYFAGLLIGHPILKSVDTELLRAIQQPCGYSLIQLCGPTGVGKTTLRAHVSRELIEQHMKDPERNPGHIPIIEMEVAALGTFRWRAFYKRILEAANEILIDYKIDMEDLERRPSLRQTATESDLRVAVEKCLRHRGTKVLILDEAHHLGKVSASKVQDQMDVLKSIANMTGTLLVLIGTYELLHLTALSGQLSRRSLSIHFPRYPANAKGMRLLAMCTKSFITQMPVEEPPTLLDQMDYLYRGSMGCVGILKQWLDKALWLALQEGATTVTRKHLEARIIHQREREEIAREIYDGERFTFESEGQEDNIDHLLGMPKIPQEPAEESHSNGRTQRPGQRKPKRDKVGGELQDVTTD